MHKTRIALAFALVLTGICGVSKAQAEANGVKFGEGRVHPFFRLDSRFDTAAGMVQPIPGGNFRIPGDLLLHFQPGIKLEMPSPTFAVSLNGNVDYVLYTGLIEPASRKSSHLAGEADLSLEFNREGVFGAEVGDHVLRSDRTEVPTLGAGVLTLFNQARLQMHYRPAGGALALEPSYRLTTEFFSSFNDGIIPPGCTAGDQTCDPAALARNNYLDHAIGVTGRWRFLPKTALVLDAAYGLRSYPQGGGTSLNTVKATLGLAGLLSTHFSTLLKAGWGHDFTLGSYSSVIGQAEFGYLMSETGSIKLGYLRTFQPNPGSGFVSYGDDRVYLDGRLLFGGRLAIHASGALDFLSFRAAESAVKRSDTKVTVDLGADYEVAPWLSVGAGDAVTFQSSSGRVFYSYSEGSFTRNETYLRLQVIY